MGPLLAYTFRKRFAPLLACWREKGYGGNPKISWKTPNFPSKNNRTSQSLLKFSGMAGVVGETMALELVMKLRTTIVNVHISVPLPPNIIALRLGAIIIEDHIVCVFTLISRVV